MVNSLQRFEHFFERLMEGSVGRIFRSPIQPAEIGRRLERAMEANQLSTVDGIVVPNDYTVHLNPNDMVVFADFTTSLCRQMEDWLIDLADERNYGFIDKHVRVQLIGEESVPPRHITVEAHITELQDYDLVQQEAIQRTEVYRVVERTGNVPPMLLRVEWPDGSEQIYPIRRQVTTIGRAVDNDVVLQTPEISRYHARIEYANGHFEIVDVGSTNGTRVNGQRIQRERLEDGDDIGLAIARLQLTPAHSSRQR